MEIKRLDRETKGAYIIEHEGERLAEMTYTKAGNRIIIDHTEVSDKLRGQGAGKKLVLRAVEDARNGGYKILPLCTFAKSVFDRTPELHDVLD